MHVYLLLKVQRFNKWPPALWRSRPALFAGELDLFVEELKGTEGLLFSHFAELVII